SHWLVTIVAGLYLDGGMQLWDLTAHPPVAIPLLAIPLQGNVLRIPNVLVISPHNHWLAARDDQGVLLWNITSPTPGLVAQSLPGYTEQTTALAFSTDGRWLATSNFTGTVRLWDMTTQPPSLLRFWQAHQNNINALV